MAAAVLTFDIACTALQAVLCGHACVFMCLSAQDGGARAARVVPKCTLLWFCAAVARVTWMYS